jgi:protein ImuB
VSIVISHNAQTAVCLARSGRSGYVPEHEEAPALAPLSVGMLGAAPEHVELFAHWGIRTLGELARMPEEGLITRLGQEGKRLRTLALGRGEHLLLPVEPVDALEEYVAFDAPVDLLDSLLFVLQPMLDQLLARARLRTLALSQLSVTLTLDSRQEHRVQVRPALPNDDKKLLLKLLHLEMTAYPPAAAVSALRLAAEAAPLSKVQLGLFSPQLPETSRLDVTLARLRALVGEDRVGRAVLDDTHRTDSFHMEPFTVTDSTSIAEAETSATRTALRRLRPPEPAQVALREGRPVRLVFRAQHYVVERAYGPWRASGAWWSADAWTSEQWDVLARAELHLERRLELRPEQGSAVLACCLTRDVTSGTSWVEALYD